MNPMKNAHDVGEAIDFWWKVIRAIVGVGILAGAAWTQFLGPGLKESFRNFTGVTEIVERLDFVERYMPPPRVVVWNESNSRQLGTCLPNGICSYVLTGARTEYGELCGKVTSAIPEVRTKSGDTVQVEYHLFEPVRLTRNERSFRVPLQLNGLIPPGQHEFRTMTTYESCPGVNEPMPRWTPWFPLLVAPPQE